VRISIDDRKLLWLVLIVVAVFFRQPLAATLLPFILALALAAILEPIVNFFQSRARMPRPVATLVSLALVVIAGGYALLVITTKVVSELVQMGTLLQRYQRVPVDFATYVIERLNEINELFDQRGLPVVVQQNIIQTVENLAAAAVNWATQGINLVVNAVSQVPYLVVVTVVAMIATYFLVKDRDQLIESALSVSPPAMQERVRETWSRILEDIVGFFKATLILISLTVIMTSLGLIAIGVNYWMTLAIIAGILDMIPVLGPGFLFVPWAIGARDARPCEPCRPAFGALFDHLSRAPALPGQDPGRLHRRPSLVDAGHFVRRHPILRPLRLHRRPDLDHHRAGPL